MISLESERAGGPRVYTQIHELLRGHEHDAIDRLVEGELARLKATGVKRRGPSDFRRLAEDNVGRSIAASLEEWPFYPEPDAILVDPHVGIRWALVAILATRDQRIGEVNATSIVGGITLGKARFEPGLRRIRVKLEAVPLSGELAIRW